MASMDRVPWPKSRFQSFSHIQCFMVPSLRPMRIGLLAQNEVVDGWI